DQAGVPVVSMTVHCENGRALLEAAQSRFAAIGSPRAAPTSWIIPLCITYSADGKEQHECEVLDKPSAEWALKTQSCPAWFLGNDGEIGYYRVQAPAEWIKKLLADKAKHLDVAERVGVFGDIGALVDSGVVSP